MRNFYRFISHLFPNIYFYVKDSQSIYLTFDDGPTKHTVWILKELEKYSVKATFFLIGENAAQRPHLVKQIINEGHSIGYHSYNHDNLWRIRRKKAIADFKKSRELFDSKLYRPPYGKITPRVYQYLKNKCKVILWDISFRDWEKHDDLELMMEKKLKKIKPGSIMLLHDNNKSFENLKIILPRILKSGKKLEYKFESID